MNKNPNDPTPKTSTSESRLNNITANKQAKLPKLIDLGADKCIPCKMMKPILDGLKTDYAGKLDVEVIDVWVNPKEGNKYEIKLIPTQIFFDPDGNEFYRHEGFMSKDDILDVFKKKGISLE
ncbi:TPA: thioredoxin [bacterium]|nr:thioredoxin [bacterium]